MEQFTAIVLAAGKGERMSSPFPKVLHELAGRPLIYYVLRELAKLKGELGQMVIVVGYKAKTIERQIKSLFKSKAIVLPKGIKIDFVYQPKTLGTANAVDIATKAARCDNILVICGDTPLVTADTLSKFISSFLEKKPSCLVLTAPMTGKNTLGTIIRDDNGRIKAIQEKAVASDTLCEFRHRHSSEEVNSGIYCFERMALLKYLPQIKLNAKKREYFLTDIIEIIYNNEEALVDSYFLDNEEEILGINTPNDLRLAEELMRKRILERFAAKGVKIVDFGTTFIQEDVKIGKNTIIYPFTFIEKNVIIGSHCSLGPFIRLRKGTSLGNNTQVGNFLEINRCKLSRNVKVKHFGYLGDTTVASGVNIGAGTVVANYDGKHKNKTYIGKNAFIGSDTVLIAPLRIGERGMTGAGSVVTRNVKAKAVVLGVPARVFKKKKKG